MEKRMIGGSVPRDSNFVRALGSMTTHSFAPGRGYWEHDTAPIIHGGPAPAPQCDPPIGTPNASKHVLARGGAQLEFVWVAGERAWHRYGGLRLAFTCEYLTREGWVYVGVAP